MLVEKIFKIAKSMKNRSKKQEQKIFTTENYAKIGNSGKISKREKEIQTRMQKKMRKNDGDRNDEKLCIP